MTLNKKEDIIENNTNVVNVKVAYIRPTYNNLEEWCNDDNNIYIGRKSIVFINGVRYPKKDSIWCNPFKINNTNNREQVIQQYEKYILDKISNDDLVDQLLLLNNKNLGCWCKDKNNTVCCHGDVLVDLITRFLNKT